MFLCNSASKIGRGDGSEARGKRADNTPRLAGMALFCVNMALRFRYEL